MKGLMLEIARFRREKLRRPAGGLTHPPHCDGRAGSPARPHTTRTKESAPTAPMGKCGRNCLMSQTEEYVRFAVRTDPCVTTSELATLTDPHQHSVT